jgi:hypothetical protein
MSSIEQKSRALNGWLRLHTDYKVTLSFAELYGCLEISLLQKGQYVHIWIGDTLEKRLDEVLAFLAIVPLEEKEPHETGSL